MLQGGPLQTSVLIASATMKKGENLGLPVPLHCTWYNVSPTNKEFRVIENVSGACYQPSINDVGNRICVHAIPASDAEEYQGMPMFAEVGPIEMDEVITEQIELALDNFKKKDYSLLAFDVTVDKL